LIFLVFLRQKKRGERTTEKSDQFLHSTTRSAGTERGQSPGKNFPDFVLDFGLVPSNRPE
jgi:hypothetical protein